MFLDATQSLVWWCESCQRLFSDTQHCPCGTPPLRSERRSPTPQGARSFGAGLLSPQPEGGASRGGSGTGGSRVAGTPQHQGQAGFGPGQLQGHGVGGPMHGYGPSFQSQGFTSQPTSYTSQSPAFPGTQSPPGQGKGQWGANAGLQNLQRPPNSGYIGSPGGSDLYGLRSGLTEERKTAMLVRAKASKEKWIILMTKTEVTERHIIRASSKTATTPRSNKNQAEATQ